jgi:hypothetical protein
MCQLIIMIAVRTSSQAPGRSEMGVFPTRRASEFRHKPDLYRRSSDPICVATAAMLPQAKPMAVQERDKKCIASTRGRRAGPRRVISAP